MRIMNSKEKLIELLKKLQEEEDTEVAHGAADQALLDYINDPEITAAYDAIDKWFA